MATAAETGRLSVHSLELLQNPTLWPWNQFTAPVVLSFKKEPKSGLKSECSC